LGASFLGAKVTGAAFFAGSAFLAGAAPALALGEALANPDVETTDARRKKIENFMFVLLRVCYYDLLIIEKKKCCFDVACTPHAGLHSAYCRPPSAIFKYSSANDIPLESKKISLIS
jgi:hypothetical protein